MRAVICLCALPIAVTSRPALFCVTDRLNVSVQIVMIVVVFDSVEQLNGQHGDGLE